MTKYSYLRRLTTLASLVLVLLSQAFIVTPAEAQSSDTQEKIRLFSTALRARDAGDLDLAKKNLEELLKIAPNDVNVQRLLLSVNKDIERRDAGQSTVFGQAAAVSDFSPEPAPGYVAPPPPPPARTTGGTNGTGTAAQATSVMSVTTPSGSQTEVVDPNSVEGVIASESAKQEQALAQAKVSIDDSKQLIDSGRYEEAETLLSFAQSSLVLNTKTVDTLEEIRELRGDILLDQGEAELEAKNAAGAAPYLAEYRDKLGDDARARAFEAKIKALQDNPWYQDPEELSPEFMENQGIVDQLMVKARAQMLYGDYEGSVATLREVEARDPTNAAAKGLQIAILENLRQTNYLDHSKTRDEMLQEVARSWQRPQIFDVTPPDLGPPPDDTIIAKLQSIQVPSVNLSGVPLSRAIETLSELSVEFDPLNKLNPPPPPSELGVNIVPSNWGGSDPLVTITLRFMSMDKILDFVTQSVNYTWDVQNDAVVVRPGGDGVDFLETEFFPLSRATQIRLSGVGEAAGAAVADDPFNPAPAAAPAGGGVSDAEESLRNFFQKAGVDFDGTQGSSLAFDGAQLIVTQTPKNLEKMRNILRRYDQPKQVEIEAKFLEVNQGVLDEVGFNWSINTPVTGTGLSGGVRSNNRSLASAFGINQTTNDLTIDSPETDEAEEVDLEVPQNPPSIPNVIDIGADGAGYAQIRFDVLGSSVQALITALSRQTGSDLLSSPRLTVLSGRTAQIVVAQELRYPENYSDIESEVGTGGQANTGSAGVTITAGTPQDFTVRNVGVEMEVTPTVEENQNISLKLEPRVTEFEGFVEYGGTSVAISGGTTVTVPSGFFQPIFSTREVRTEVTVYDGATVVIGGLTREEVQTVNDKVPVLGDIPLIGRLFQSKGETSAKRNLLIFITANLISPGGSPSQQDLRNVQANSLFQNPILVTPGGGVSREIREE